MQTINFNLFPTPLTFTKEFLSKTEAKKFFSYCLKSKAEKYHSILGDGVSSHDGVTNFLLNAISDGAITTSIYARMEQAIKDYASTSGYEYNKISDSWFNIQNNESHLTQHCHPKSVMSGVLYLNIDKESSPIYFYNPNSFVQYLNINLTTEHGFQWVNFLPEVGDLLIFPSWLKHGNNGDLNKTKNRTVVGFNTI